MTSWSAAPRGPEGPGRALDLRSCANVHGCAKRGVRAATCEAILCRSHPGPRTLPPMLDPVEPSDPAGGQDPVEPRDRVGGEVERSGRTDVDDAVPSSVESSKGRYQIDRELGRGVMGIVLQAWDEQLERPLALKYALAKCEFKPNGETPERVTRRLQRFRNEARITASLDHPGIVPLFDAGVDAEARAFFTMRLVEGRDFSEVLDLVAAGDADWTLTRALNALLRATEAWYGFSPDGRGSVAFTEHVKLYARDDPEIARLHAIAKEHFIPSL